LLLILEANEMATLGTGGDSNDLSNDTAPAGQDEISVELMDTNEETSLPEAVAIGSTDAQASDIYIPLSSVGESNDDISGNNSGRNPRQPGSFTCNF
jgi:hypothetical protein